MNLSNSRFIKPLEFSHILYPLETYVKYLSDGKIPFPVTITTRPPSNSTYEFKYINILFQYIV